MLEKQFEKHISKVKDEAISSGVALAVSGGIDSMALLYVANQWASKHKIKITIFSVDHNLRPESRKDVEFVSNVATGLGLDFYSLEWLHEPLKSRVQEKAREARYNLITNKCNDLGIGLLLTAHHLDDIIESYLMKKDRGSSALGLSYSSSYFYNNIHIYRPFIEEEKSDIKNYLIENNYSWREDETNSSDYYERNRVRKKIVNLRNSEKERLKNNLKTATTNSKTLNELLIKIIAESVVINNYGFAVCNLKAIREQEYDIVLQLINYALTIISGKSIIPRYRSVEKIINNIKKQGYIACSLHSCILVQKGDSLVIYKEMPDYKSDNFQNKKWDNRFDINIDNRTNKYIISNLTPSDYAQIKDDIDLTKLAKESFNTHKKILFTLPVIKKLEKVVAIPHIYYYDKNEFKNEVKVTFVPNFISRFTHFV